MQVKFSRPSTFDLQATPDWLNETKQAMIKHWSKSNDEFTGTGTLNTDYAGCVVETVQITDYQSFDIVYRYNVMSNIMEVRVIAYH
jgi:hypothetical protein